MQYTYMQKISITFNEYEYKYLKYARDIINQDYTKNFEIKDILYGILFYTNKKISEDDLYLKKFVNIFLIKNNAKPLVVNEIVKDLLLNQDIARLSRKLDITISYNSALSSLYVLRLDDDLLNILKKMRDVILKNAVTIKKIRYSEIFRDSLHFVIDNYDLKKEFFSVIYTLKLLSYTDNNDLIGYFSDDIQVEQNQIDEKSECLKELENDYKIYIKLKKWLSVTELNEKPEEYNKIRNDIGHFSGGVMATDSFLDFVFLLVNLYNDLGLSCVAFSHFSFNDMISIFLEEAKKQYIESMDSILNLLKKEGKQ